MSGPTPRRSFLQRCGRLAVAAGCVPAAALVGGCAAVPRVTPTREGRFARVPLDAFEGASGVLVDVPGGGPPIYLHRHSARSFSAVLLRCTHRGCVVEPVGSRLACPCHGSEFEPDGALVSGPADRPLRRYPASLAEDHVSIDLGASTP